MHIVVSDINDNRPQFYDKQKSVTIAENNVVGVIVAAFSVGNSKLFKKRFNLLMYIYKGV